MKERATTHLSDVFAYEAVHGFLEIPETEQYDGYDGIKQRDYLAQS